MKQHKKPTVVVLLVLVSAVSCTRTQEQPSQETPLQTTEQVQQTAEQPNKPDQNTMVAPEQIIKPEPAVSQDSIEAFPGVYVNREQRYVEFDGEIAIDAHHLRPGVRVPPKPTHEHVAVSADKPIVYLELIACSTGTKDHESIVSTDIQPSHIHAALLMIGAESGTPGTFRWEGREVFPVDPTGGGLCVAVVFADSTVLDVRDMILDVRTGETMHKTKPDTAWVFAGSKFVEHNGREVYASDGTGIIVGLATFGTELAGYAQTFSHESEAETPVWIADAASTPEVGSHVRVRLSLMR